MGAEPSAMARTNKVVKKAGQEAGQGKGKERKGKGKESKASQAKGNNNPATRAKTNTHNTGTRTRTRTRTRVGPTFAGPKAGRLSGPALWASDSLALPDWDWGGREA